MQNGEWGGNPELYAAAWLYGVNITIYSQEYTNTNGMLVINADGLQGAIDTVRAMWTVSRKQSLQQHPFARQPIYPNEAYKECPAIPVLSTAGFG